ncbi:hypothetical protein N9039_01705, partial [Verrucomicrobiales bacterium]|nr:hypothetical protein [Verrucomicrobiales bacterium]
MAAKRFLAYLYSDYGMLVVLVLLSVIISLLTIKEQFPEGGRAGDQLGKRIANAQGAEARVLAITRPTQGDQAFVERLKERVVGGGGAWLGHVQGDPQDARRELERLNTAGSKITTMA